MVFAKTRMESCARAASSSSSSASEAEAKVDWKNKSFFCQKIIWGTGFNLPLALPS